MSLIEEIRSGNTAAIRQLYQENAQDVFDFAKKITNNQDLSVRISQDTLTELVQAIQNGFTPSDVGSEALKFAYQKARAYMDTPDNRNTDEEYPEDDQYYEEDAGFRDFEPAQSKRDNYRPQERYEPEYDSYDRERYDQPNRKKVRKGKGAGFYICLLINILLLLLIIWMALGLLMNLKIIPYYDLGYVWFDNHIYKLF